MTNFIDILQSHLGLGKKNSILIVNLSLGRVFGPLTNFFVCNWLSHKQYGSFDFN